MGAYPGDARSRGLVVVNDDGFPVDAVSGVVLRDYVFEGTEEHPARPVRFDYGNTGVLASQNPLNKLIRYFGADMVVGVRDGAEARARLVRALADEVEAVLRGHGIQYHRSQCEALAEKLLGLGVKPSIAVKVLDCALDPECDEYGPELRRPVEGAFEDVFNQSLGPNAVVKAQIITALNRWFLNDVISPGEVYGEYQELSALARALGRRVYRRSLIKAAIASVIARALGIERARELLRDVGEEQAVELLRELRRAEG
ncbi:hypothetical protein [Vulcanisaeta distributa]|uniref:Uncharacterized protein n=1 Tax=Vulcanisaeta distributa (strain DSM 14429 / JCM 11212 / NBRC 100878 / IC-017) TaxID=572478 RepID=E1QSP9_VULDI|nr:hypothetical protein [Vulcanisaeta distributa]ADN49566.1 hypothetical protein Vdis_0153 [Vulcanisaeta distributa DSM 14429]